MFEDEGTKIEYNGLLATLSEVSARTDVCTLSYKLDPMNGVRVFSEEFIVWRHSTGQSIHTDTRPAQSDPLLPCAETNP